MSATLDPTWRSVFSASALERGAAYARTGKVDLLEEVRGGWEAIVRGRVPYRVFVPAREHGPLDLHASCTCPWFQEGHLCKHMAAVCFALEEREAGEEGDGPRSKGRRPTHTPPKADTPSETPLSQLVAQADDITVRSFLLSLLVSDELLETRFRAACNPNDFNLAKRALKKELATIVREHSHRGFIDYRAAMPFARDYHDAMEQVITPYAAQGNSEAIFELVETVITSLRTVHIDDSDGFFGDTLMFYRDYWDQAFAGLDTQAAHERVRRLLKRAADISRAKRTSDIDWFLVDEMEGYVVEHFADSPTEAELVVALADKNLERARADLEHRRKELETRRARWVGAGSRVFDLFDYESPRWVVVRMRAMRALGASVDELLEYARPYATSQEVLLKLADLLVEDGRGDEAMSLLEAAVDDEGVSDAATYAAQLRLREMFREAGDEARLRRTLVWLLAQASCAQKAPSAVTLLHELKELNAPDEWSRTRDEVLGQMRDTSALCACLADEGMANELVNVLESRDTFASFVSYEDLLARTHPKWLVDRYRSRAEQEAGMAHDRRGYRTCAKTLAHLATLPEGDKVARELAAEFRKRWPRRTSLAAELSAVGL